MNVEEVHKFLDPDEPDYAAAAIALGPDSLEALAELAQDDDALLASKAVYLAGLIGGDGSVPILTAAASSPEPAVRVSAAAAIRNVEDEIVNEIGAILMTDSDVGVRKVAVQSFAASASEEVRSRFRDVVEADEDEAIRSMAPALED